MSVDSSGWTLTTLLAHLTAMIDALGGELRALMAEMDLRLEQRYQAQQKALEAALLAQEKAVQTAMIAQEKAAERVRADTDARLGLLNELRTGVATKEEVEALEKVVTAIAARVDRSEGHSSGLSAGWAILLGAVGLIGTVVALLAR